jgi:hypothetical protein
MQQLLEVVVTRIARLHCETNVLEESKWQSEESADIRVAPAVK